MKKKLTTADTTEYPKIFNNTYWGAFEFQPDELEITHNRNYFIKDFNISKVYDGDFIDMCDERLRNYGRCFDHFEFYSTKGGRIIFLNSPYIGALGEKGIDFLRSIGMDKYATLYHKDAVSFVMDFANIKEFHVFCKKVIGKSMEETTPEVITKEIKEIDLQSIDEKVYAILNEIEPAIKLAIAKVLQL
jgi:hypothetical protein